MARPFTTLGDIGSDEAALVGGKAFNCARLMLAGIPVPEGVVITTAANETSLESSQLRDWLAALPAGILLAVRSSGVEEDSVADSFAGIHETRLNVGPKDVPEAVRGCWASAISPAALAYRRARHLTTENVRIAVLIQRMIQPIASGVAFTVNPISGRKDELLINSVFGLGEALVSGQVEPDEFKIRKADCEVLTTHLAGKIPSLPNEQVQELSALLLRIEAHFGSAQDVEWCYDGRRLWIVQSRLVTS